MTLNNNLEGLSLTAPQVKLLESTCVSLRGKAWSLDSPIFLFNRCWLKLEKISFNQLNIRLPPDTSSESPEILNYHQLLKSGYDPLLAIQECWSKYGIDEFHRALRRYWHFQDLGNDGWTFNSYLKLFSEYRRSFDQLAWAIPLIILAHKILLIDNLLYGCLLMGFRNQSKSLQNLNR